MWQREIRKLDRLRDSQCSCQKDNIFKVSILLKSLLINFWPSFLSVSSRRISLVSIIPSWLEVKIVKVFWFWYKKNIFNRVDVFKRDRARGTELRMWFLPYFSKLKAAAKVKWFRLSGLQCSHLSNCNLSFLLDTVIVKL